MPHLFFRAVQVCLEEVQSCDIFIGLLGSRYGSIPSQSAIPESEEFQWIHEYDNKNASVTELEMHLAMSKENAQQRTFFYFRDNSFQQYVQLKSYLSNTHLYYNQIIIYTLCFITETFPRIW